MKNVNLSIIVPVYNVENRLRSTLQSILNQTYHDFELILIDDGSCDRSKEICLEFAKSDSRIIVFSQNNQGVSAARNQGLNLARGRYIAFVDGDDSIEPEMYECLIAGMTDGIDITACRFNLCYENGKIVKYCEFNLHDFLLKPFNLHYFIYNDVYKLDDNLLEVDNIFGSVCRSVFRKEIIQKFNIQFNRSINIAEDLVFMMEYCSVCKQGFIVDKYLYHYWQSRTDSAISREYKQYNEDHYYKSKILILRMIDVLSSVKYYTGVEKRNISLYLKYKMALNILNIEYLKNPNVICKMKSYCRDSLFSELTSFDMFFHLFRIGVNKKIILLLFFMKCHLWHLIKFIYQKKFGKK